MVYYSYDNLVLSQNGFLPIPQSTVENSWLATLGQTWLGYNLENRTNDEFTDWIEHYGPKPNDTEGNAQLIVQYGTTLFGTGSKGTNSPEPPTAIGWIVADMVKYAYAPTTCYLHRSDSG